MSPLSFSSSSRWMLSCHDYPNCRSSIWLNPVETIHVHDELCPRCGSKYVVAAKLFL